MICRTKATSINNIPIANAHRLYCNDILTIFCGYNCLNTVIVTEQASPTNETKPTTIFKYSFLYFTNSAVIIPKRNAKSLDNLLHLYKILAYFPPLCV